LHDYATKYFETRGKSMKAETKTRTIRNLIIFVICIIAIPWLGWGLDVQRGFDSHQQDGSLGWLFFILTPLATALLLRSRATGNGTCSPCFFTH